MLRCSILLVLAALGIGRDVLAGPVQFPMEVSVNAPTDASTMTIPATRPKRKLQGRFLHITDIHPDPHYRPGMSEESACHRKKPRKSEPRSGVYGLAYSECDSPFSLTNYTMDWLDEHWSEEIDFVIWTGDSARHDNDRKLPRTTKEIYELNRIMARKMESVFLSKGVPVVPSIGNNDIWRPNDITFEFSAIWRNFIPFPSYQVFQRGGYYSIEVIPDSVAVISLNTMYFYAANKAVGGCEPKESQDPGNLQFDWLEVQLEGFRNRGMQVWITGHVPPSAQNYFSECHVRYVEVSLMYQDTILGHLYGHMNADHDTIHGAHASGSSDGTAEEEGEEDSGVDVEKTNKKKHVELYDRLLKSFSQVPKLSRKIGHDNLVVVNVAPSVVPNPYLPSFRIFSYNVSGTRYEPEMGGPDLASKRGRGDCQGDFGCWDGEYGDGGGDGWEDDEGRRRGGWNSSPNSPSRKNGLWTPLGYAQYYLPKLNDTRGMDRRPGKYELEYMTYSLSALHPPRPPPGDVDGEIEFRYPVPVGELPRSLRAGNVSKSRYAPYGMGDLTIPSWTELAGRLGKMSKGEKLRRRFRWYMYMGRGEEQ